jgi:hypothetical protein
MIGNEPLTLVESGKGSGFTQWDKCVPCQDSSLSHFLSYVAWYLKLAKLCCCFSNNCAVEEQDVFSQLIYTN